jgi:hypothetical protein
MAEPERRFEVAVVSAPRAEERVYPTTGAYGAVHPTGDHVIVHLYYESITTPTRIIHPVDEKGSVDLTESEQLRESSITRVIHSSSIMTPDMAETIGRWLIQQAEAARRVSDDAIRRTEEKHEAATGDEQ